MNRSGNTGQRTLLAAMLLSLPGPLVLGAGLLLGRSSTQLADFIRRTAELGAIIVSWAVYRATIGRGMEDKARKARLEHIARLCVGASMCLGGAAMALIALLSGSGDKGNVIPALVIAVLGIVTNGFFWLRYRGLNQREENAVIGAQSKLYRAKTLTDICVTAALAVIAAAPGSQAALYMDIIGSLSVALYLMASGSRLLIAPRPA